MSGLLDELAAGAPLAVRERRTLSAKPGEVFAALSRLRAGALVQRAGVLGRGLGALGIADPSGLLYAQLLAGGFVVLAADPLREIVVGRILARGRASKPPLRGRGDFLASTRPGTAKVALAVGVGGGEVTAELRLRVVGLGRGARVLRPAVARGLRAFLDALESEIAAGARSRNGARVA